MYNKIFNKYLFDINNLHKKVVFVTYGIVTWLKYNILKLY